MLRAYRQATWSSPQNEALCRTRIDCIILSILAAMKSKEESNPQSSLASLESHRSLHIQFENDLAMHWTLDEGPRILKGRVNYSVWYLHPGSMETNCVMVEAKRRNNYGEGVNQCLAYMGKQNRHQEIFS